MKILHIRSDKKYLHQQLDFISKQHKYTSECIIRKATEEEKIKYNIKIK